MDTMKLSKGGAFTGTAAVSDVLRGIAQTQALVFLKDVTIPAVTNATGHEANLNTIALPGKLSDIQTQGAAIAMPKAGLEAGLLAALNGLSSVLASANVVSEALGLGEMLDASGATAGASAPKVDAEQGGATTGPTARNVNAVRKRINGFAATVVGRVRVVAAATGVDIHPLLLGEGDSAPSILPQVTDTGAAGQTAISLTAGNAMLANYGVLIATLVELMSRVAEAAEDPKPKVVAV